MLKLNIEEISNLIEKEETFSAISDDGAFLISIEEYVPYICCAIHNGGNIRSELRDKLALSKMDRWKEEDPFTANFIASLPIRVIVYDSRYEYDLNRSIENCIYDEAWGKKVWNTELSEEDKEISLQKHHNFYKVIDKLVSKLETKFQSCLVYDIHSYNYKRVGAKDTFPVFNLGTEKIVDPKYRKYINKFLKELNLIELDSIKTTVGENAVFYGRGYLLEYIMSHFNNTLVFATEIKKIYVDENSGDEYPELIDKISVGLKKAIVNSAYYFIKANTSLVVSHKYQLLTSLAEDSLKIVDGELFSFLRGLEILSYVNPINIEHEKKKFFSSKFKYEPEFRYKPLAVNVNELKRKVYQLPTQKIKDITLRYLYEDMVESYANKIELLTLRGKKEFLYSSLKYFGKPEEVDISNAKYILHCANEEINEELLDSNQTKELIEEVIKEYGFKCHIKIVKNLSANAMVINSTKTLMLRKDAKVTKTYAQALANHEIGIHMLTTFNAQKQPLNFLKAGLPRHTATQEGLAILSEYLSGFLTIDRLKELAHRVIAIDLMIKGADFKELFTILKEDYNLEDEKAFFLTTRVLRGGGFTKDYLYLKGFKKMLDLYNNGVDLSVLLLGKTSVEYMPILRELVEREMLNKPMYTPLSFTIERKKSVILDYVLKGLK